MVKLPHRIKLVAMCSLTRTLNEQRDRDAAALIAVAAAEQNGEPTKN